MESILRDVLIWGYLVLITFFWVYVFGEKQVNSVFKALAPIATPIFKPLAPVANPVFKALATILKGIGIGVVGAWLLFIFGLGAVLVIWYVLTMLFGV